MGSWVLTVNTVIAFLVFAVAFPLSLYRLIKEPKDVQHFQKICHRCLPLLCVLMLVGWGIEGLYTNLTIALLARWFINQAICFSLTLTGIGLSAMIQGLYTIARRSDAPSYLLRSILVVAILFIVYTFILDSMLTATLERQYAWPFHFGVAAVLFYYAIFLFFHAYKLLVVVTETMKAMDGVLGKRDSLKHTRSKLVTICWAVLIPLIAGALSVYVGLSDISNRKYSAEEGRSVFYIAATVLQGAWIFILLIWIWPVRPTSSHAQPNLKEALRESGVPSSSGGSTRSRPASTRPSIVGTPITPTPMMLRPPSLALPEAPLTEPLAASGRPASFSLAELDPPHLQSPLTSIEVFVA